MSHTVIARTLKQPAAVSGAGLHSGQTVTLRLLPAPAGHGIRFTRTDLPERPSVAVTDVEANAAPFRTVIKKGAAEVHTVEHLLSALAGLGITDCAVEMDGIEVPGLDGSAAEFAVAIHRAGVVDAPNGTATPLIVTEPITIDDGMAKIQALPNAGGLKISYTLDYPGHPLAQGRYDFELREELFLKEIAPARTFAIRKDAEAMRAAGLGKGATLQNTVVIEGSEALETTLRFANEPVRHKILDLIGDLYVLGRPIHAHIIAHCSGHRTNRLLATKLAERFPLNDKGKEEKNEGAAKDSKAMQMDINEIKTILPHRYPMLMVDRIVEYVPGKRAVGIKNVSANESFFQGHFPEEPIMPGVLILEALAQVCCVLVLKDINKPGAVSLFTGAEDVAWRRKVVPGDQLRLEAELDKLRLPFGRLKVKATVDGALACEATIKFMVQLPATADKKEEKRA